MWLKASKGMRVRSAGARVYRADGGCDAVGRVWDVDRGDARGAKGAGRDVEPHAPESIIKGEAQARGKACAAKGLAAVAAIEAGTVKEDSGK